MWPAGWPSNDMHVNSFMHDQKKKSLCQKFTEKKLLVDKIFVNGVHW